MSDENKKLGVDVKRGQFWKNKESNWIYRVVDKGFSFVKLERRGSVMKQGLLNFLEKFEPAMFSELEAGRFLYKCNHKDSFIQNGLCPLGAMSSSGQWFQCNNRAEQALQRNPSFGEKCPYREAYDCSIQLGRKGTNSGNKKLSVNDVKEVVEGLKKQVMEGTEDLKKQITELKSTLKYKELHQDVLERALEAKVPDRAERHQALVTAELAQANAKENDAPLTLEYGENKPFPLAAELMEKLERVQQKADRYKRLYLFEKFLRERGNGKNKKVKTKEPKHPTFSRKLTFEELPIEWKDKFTVFYSRYWARNACDDELVVVEYFYVDTSGYVKALVSGQSRLQSYTLIADLKRIQEWCVGDIVKALAPPESKPFRTGYCPIGKEFTHPTTSFNSYIPVHPDEAVDYWEV